MDKLLVDVADAAAGLPAEPDDALLLAAQAYLVNIGALCRVEIEMPCNLPTCFCASELGWLRPSAPLTNEKVQCYRRTTSPTGPVRGKIKFYNPKDDFGFIKLLDGGPDVFLHASVAKQLPPHLLKIDAELIMLVARTEKGLRVTEAWEASPESAASQKVAS